MLIEGKLRAAWRISGFRLVLRSVLLSLAGALLVFGIVHHAAETGWRNQIDSRIASAQADILGDLHTNNEGLAANVRTTLAEGSGMFYAAQAADGTALAGNFQLSRSIADGWSGLQTVKRQPGLVLPAHVLAIRGTMLRLPDGERLFIAADSSALITLKSLIASSFLTVFGTILVLGLVTSILAARTTLARVDCFTKALQDIMAGDLSARLKINGTGDEFDRLALEMNKMLQRIQELMENLRQVTSDISHDLRAPLARLRTHLELSRARFEDPVLAETIDEAIGQLDGALNIFAAMLRIAEIEAGARRAQFCPVDLSALLTLLAESYEPAFAEQGISLTAEIEPGLSLEGDRELLAQAITNLLDNIALHAQGASRATIRAAAQPGRIMLQLADDGIGIPVEARTRIWQRFVRLDTARHSPGFGLGLSLVESIAALHGGNVSLVDSARGLCIRIELPQTSRAALA